MKFLSVLLVILFTFDCFGAGIISCTHPEICRLINLVTNNELKTNSIVIINGDPHEFEPDSNQIKELLTAKFLIAGPSELNPWLKKVLFQRSKDAHLKTFSLVLNPQVTNLYSPSNKEALSHFWLYPEIFCDMKKQIAHVDFIKVSKLHPDCDYLKNLNNKIKNEVINISRPIILSHDALYPLLYTYLQKKSEIVNLKGSGHHDEVSSAAVKLLYNALEKPVVTWIIETNISLPTNIKNKIRNNDHIIKIDTANSENSNFKIFDPDFREFPILYELINEIKK